MAHLFITPEKDATIFSKSSLILQNSGRDEILEIEKTLQNEDAPGGLNLEDSNLPSISRTLIKFDLDQLTSLVPSESIQSAQYTLNLKTVESIEIPLSYTIEAWPISQSWQMGTGRKYDEITTTGVSWKFKDEADQNGHLWYYYNTSVPTPVENTFSGCWSGSWSGYWKGYAYGKIDGVFNGDFSGSFVSESISVGTHSIFESENSMLDFISENLGSIFETEELNHYSGSFTGYFVGYLSGSFSGSAIIHLVSNSIDYVTTDNSLIDQSGGGTWYANQYVSIQGGCLDNFAYPTCSFYSASFSTSSYKATQSFNYESSDISMDVTNIVNAWLSGSIPNEGFILKHSGECDDFDYGKLRFFSMDTNTIYSPTLEVKWDDSVYSPDPSASLNTDTNKVVYVNNLRPVYKYGSKSRIDIFSRYKFPTRTFARQSDYLIGTYLPVTSYYAIKDAESEEIIVNFDDNFSKISCDASGSFFVLNTMGLPQERFFKVIVKVVQNDLIDYYEDSGVFKISR